MATYSGIPTKAVQQAIQNKDTLKLQSLMNAPNVSQAVKAQASTFMNTSNPTSIVPLGAPIPTNNAAVTGNLYGDAKNQSFNAANNTGITPTFVAGISDKTANNVVTSPVAPITPIQGQQTEKVVDSYNPQYASVISNLISQLMTMQNNPQKFDPNTDQSLQIAQQQAMSQADRNNARRNMLYAGSSKFGENSALQAGQRLIPQYQERFDNQEQQKLGNLYSQLSMLQSADNTGYNRYRDTVNDSVRGVQYKDTRGDVAFSQNLASNQYADAKNEMTQNKGLQQSKLIQDAYGIYIDPNLLVPLSEQESRSVNLFMQGQDNPNDYQEAIDKVGKNNEFYPLLARARALKIASNPQSLLQYGSQIGGNTQGGRMNEQQIKSAQYDNVINESKAKYADPVAQAQLKLLELQLSTGRVDEEGKKIANQYLPAKYAADINQSNASASASLTNASASTMNAQTNKDKSDWEKTQTGSKGFTPQQYYDSALDLRKEGIGDMNIVDSVMTYNLSQQQKADILNRLGISPTLK